MRITPKQKKLLEYIYEFTVENGYAPSQREIANHFGWKSLGTVQDYLKKLIAKGLLKKEWNARRAIEVEPAFLDLHIKPKQATELPLLGSIAAGQPIEAVDESQNSLFVPNEMLGSGDHYALAVEGNSMVEDGILDGDSIIIRRQENADDGETVVALLDNGATVKRLYRKGRRIELRPANKEMKSFYVKPSQLRIQGIVVGLYRRY